MKISLRTCCVLLAAPAALAFSHRNIVVKYIFVDAKKMRREVTSIEASIRIKRLSQRLVQP